MEEKELHEAEVTRAYFTKEEIPAETAAAEEAELGTRDLLPLYPFVISGGSNTERYYFLHVSKVTSYHFNVIPGYFGDESDYTAKFPLRINEILSRNAGAKIFCVFDWDTIRGNATNLTKHAAFEAGIKAELDSGAVVLCPSMPSIEYWFLLHFEDRTTLITRAGDVMGYLAPYIRPLFPAATGKLSKTLKAEKHLKNDGWVRQMCAGGKLDDAISRAEANIQRAEAGGTLDTESYSYVYKAFR